MPPRNVSALDSLSIYQVFIRNFTSRGDFDSAAVSLPKIKEAGFDVVCLTPIHPIGLARRKGTLGSPYAISDYRAVDADLGGEPGLRRYIDAAHRAHLRVMMDVVYNHTSPDSVLAREHPEWFWKSHTGDPAPRVADWSDVIDLDYSHPELWDYQIETLKRWTAFGFDGFRCDVASMVPVEFWVEARRRLAGDRPLLWLAETIYPSMVRNLRRQGFPCASDTEIHAAFDLSYDYDGWECVAAVWRGEKPLSAYLDYVAIQETLYPASARKLRFLENHDQARAASRFEGARLRSWTLFIMLLPGAFMAYMGQEVGLEKSIGLFDRNPMDLSQGDPAFGLYFERAHRLSRQARSESSDFQVRQIVEGVVELKRGGEKASYVALLNLDGRSGRIRLDRAIEGEELLQGKTVTIGPECELSLEPLVVREKD